MRKFLFLILTLPILAQTPTERVGQINTGCLDAGSTDTYACNLPLPAPVAYVTGAIYSFRANTANTGAASINFNSLGAKTIVKVAGGITTALADNDIRAGQVVVLSYDGTNMEMQSTLGNAGGGGTPVGADKTLQYNNSGTFGGASGTSWTDATRNLNILDTNSNYMFIFTTDPVGDPHCNAVFNIGCDPVRPPSVGTTPGTGAGVIELDGVPGGNTSIVTTGVGGRGGQNILWSGAGGIAPAAANASTGGDGGPLHINGGVGGAANDTANLGINVGGHGGDFFFAAGIGGAASNGSSNTGGRGGNITIQPGTGGNGATANGATGKIILPTFAGGGDQFVTVDNSGNVGTSAGLLPAGTLGCPQIYATSSLFGCSANLSYDISGVGSPPYSNPGFSTGGSYTDGITSPNAAFTVKITANGTPDSFQWKKNSGSFSSNVAITGLAQTLSDGITVTFDTTTGYALNETWVFYTNANFNLTGTGWISSDGGFQANITTDGTFGSDAIYAQIYITPPGDFSMTFNPLYLDLGLEGTHNYHNKQTTVFLDAHNGTSGITDSMSLMDLNTVQNNGGGTLTNAIAIDIENQDQGISNWAIRTGLGLVEFGDTMKAPTINITGSSFTFNSLTCTVVAGAIACS